MIDLPQLSLTVSKLAIETVKVNIACCVIFLMSENRNRVIYLLKQLAFFEMIAFQITKCWFT